MDEPCSALDPIATAKIEDLMHELVPRLHDRHRHPQHAAGGPGLRPHRVLHRRGRRDGRPARPAGRVRHDHARSSPTRPTSAPRTTSPAASADRPLPRVHGPDGGYSRIEVDDLSRRPRPPGRPSGWSAPRRPGCCRRRPSAPPASRVVAPAPRIDAGDRLGRRDRRLEDERRRVEHRGGHRLGGEAARRVDVDDAPAERAHDAPAAGVGAERDRARPRARPPTTGCRSRPSW